MKLRIVKNGLGMYSVQERLGQWPCYWWINRSTHFYEYPKTDLYELGDGTGGYFQEIANARHFVQKILFEHTSNELKKQITVVEET